MGKQYSSRTVFVIAVVKMGLHRMETISHLQPHEGERPVDVPVEEHRGFKDVQGIGN